MRELPAVTSSKVVEGALSLHYSCGGNHHHGGCQPSYSLSLRSGEVITLDLSETLQASLPSDKEINGRYVRLHLDSPKTEGINRVKSLSIVPESLRPKQFRDKWLGESPQPVLASLAPQLGSKPYVVILAKYKDNATEPHTRAYYDQLFGDVQPGLNHWFKQVSYGRMNINGSVIYGWVTLPKTYQEYLTSTGINFGNVINDACDQVDDQVDFLKVYGVNVMVNGQIGGPWGLGGGAVMTREGVQQVWGATLNMQPHAQNLMAHEMGHSLGLGHAGNEAGAEYGSVFDVMGNGAVGTNGIPYHAWHRNYLDWIKPSEVEIVWPGQSKTITLRRRGSVPDTTSKQLITAYQPGYASRFYTIEAIKGGPYEPPTSSGVLICDSDEFRPQGGPLRTLGTGPGQDGGRLYRPGDLYANPAHGLTVQVLEDLGTSYKVLVSVSASVALANPVVRTSDTGPQSLREAIFLANKHPGTTVRFAVPRTSLTGGAAIFSPASSLPELKGAGTILDGTTQTASGGNTNPQGPEVILDGTSAGDYVSGLRIKSDGITVKGISVRGFRGHGLAIEGFASNNAVVTSCTFGLSSDGAAAVPNLWDNISIAQKAKSAIIGLPGAGNVISGSNRGIGVWGTGADSHLIEGNVIGLTASGSAIPLVKQKLGISIVDGPKGVTVRGNTVSGNEGNAIEVWGPGIANTTIIRNKIGSTTTGLAKAGNGGHGVLVSAVASASSAPINTTIGGSTASARNIFGDNGYANIYIGHPLIQNVLVHGNYFGIGSDGISSLGSVGEGIVAQAGKGLFIGGYGVGEGNTIGYLSSHGIWISANDARVQGNLVGFTPSHSTAAIGRAGLILSGSLRCLVGGSQPGSGNTIGNTAHAGIALFNADSGFIQGNVVGLNRLGAAAPVGQDGVLLATGSESNLIGGLGAARNAIASCATGVVIADTGTTGNRVEGNRIGFDLKGESARPLSGHGIALWSSASGNTIGGPTVLHGNTIGNVSYDGILLYTPGNLVQQNLIGVSPSGVEAPIRQSGIGVGEACNDNRIVQNVIVRADAGIYIWRALRTQVTGCIIGFRQNGITPGSITLQGINVVDQSNDTVIGGAAAGLGNRIGNAKTGVAVWNSSGVQVHGNLIGLAANGAKAAIIEDGIGIYDRTKDARVGSSGLGSNLITNTKIGIAVWGDDTRGNWFRFNRIFNNTELGINLLRNDISGGVTLNDTLDGDSGPNDLQNYPDIQAVTGAGTLCTVRGVLNSSPNTAYTIDFYRSLSADPTSYGEGEVWVGSVTATTNSSGQAAFSVNLTVPVGQWISSTATGPTGSSTSEFSRAVKRLS